MHGLNTYDYGARQYNPVTARWDRMDTLAALSFAYDNVTGNLVSRTGVAGAGVTETFSYDALDRLTGAAPQGGTAEAFTYEDNGNIAAKAHIGSYTYQTARPHAVMSVSNTDNRIGKTQQGITYGPLGKAVSITEGSARLTLSYGPDRQRWRSRSARKWRTDTLTVETLHDGGYERVTTEDGTVREFHRLGRGLVCVVTDGGSPLVLCALTDNVGSYVQMADTLGQTRFRAGYDVWGRQTVTANAVDFQRGYGGHEMLPRFALVNMDGRLYDPNLGRFLSPDNYVQAPDDSQSFNRYSYCLNNPLKYTDPTGEVWWVPAIIGAAVGIYSGGVIANHGEYNPTKWNWSSSKTWGFILGGGIVGAASGAVGGLVASSGIPFANTASIAASSLLYSAATNLYTNGAVPISISFGAFSYNFSDKEFGFLGKKGNEWMENLDYLVGSIGNLSDILTGFKPQKVDLVTEHSDLTGHSAIVEHGTKTGVGMDDINGIVSVGPDLEDARSWHWKKGTNTWNTHSSIEDIRWINSIYVNRNTINNYASWLNYLESRGKLIYSVELSSCVTHTSIALNLSGLFNIGLHPYLLNAQMYLWSNGVRPWLISSFLRNRYR